MTLYIQDINTEEELFVTDDAIAVPDAGEDVILHDMLRYKVVERVFSFRHLSRMDDNKVSVFVERVYQ